MQRQINDTIIFNIKDKRLLINDTIKLDYYVKSKNISRIDSWRTSQSRSLLLWKKSPLY